MRDKVREERNLAARKCYARNREAYRATANASYQLNKEKRCAARNKHRHELRRIAIEGLGGKCSCCGEDRYVFLSVEHLWGDGAEHRALRESAGVMLDVIRSGFDRTTYDVLCWNCNIGKHRNGGVCPHDLEATLEDCAPPSRLTDPRFEMVSEIT